MDPSDPSSGESPKPFLFVIARGRSGRFEQATVHFGGEREVEIVYDRRVGERRLGCVAGRGPDERRQCERRRYDISQDLSLSGWAYIRRAQPNRP